TGGTLGYAAARPVVNLVTGIYTWLPRPGTPVRAGDVLYRVDDTPVTLMAGSVPAWRPFGMGVSDGPDVRQPPAGLVAGHLRGGRRGAPPTTGSSSSAGQGRITCSACPRPRSPPGRSS